MNSLIFCGSIRLITTRSISGIEDVVRFAGSFWSQNVNPQFALWATGISWASPTR